MNETSDGYQLPGVPETAVMRVLGDGFELRFSPAQQVLVGDRLIPTPIEVTISSEGHTPEFDGRIEVIDGVPRWAAVGLVRVDGGAEIRRKHLELISLDDWMEWAVSQVASQVIDGVATFPPTWRATSANKRIVQSLRKGSRRAMTDTRLQQAADIYNAAQTHGLEDVERVLGVSRATSARLVKAARDKGFIAPKGSPQ